MDGGAVQSYASRCHGICCRRDNKKRIRSTSGCFRRALLARQHVLHKQYLELTDGSLVHSCIKRLVGLSVQ